MKRFALAALGGPLIALSVAAGALATAPPGNVTVETDGCSFTVHIALEQAWPVVTWKVKVYDAANWKDGETLIKDSVSGDADGMIDAGPYTLPEGHYNVAVDNEDAVDGSSIVVDFSLSCPAVAPPTATPTTGEELPVAGTPTPKVKPTGAELPTNGGGGGNLTPPPTDTTVAPVEGGSSGLPLIALSILGIAGALAWHARRTMAVARVTRRR